MSLWGQEAGLFIFLPGSQNNPQKVAAMPRTHILPDRQGRERAGASETATAAEAVRAAATVAAEAAEVRAAAAQATAATERSLRCRPRRPHRPRPGLPELTGPRLLGVHAPWGGAQRLRRSWLLRLEELLAIRSTQKSLAFSAPSPSTPGTT